MVKRKNVSKSDESLVLTLSRRRCAICFGLHRDDSIKQGQIAHIDRDPSNSELENLIYLCLDHHDQYDSTTRQSKGLKPAEVIHYRQELYDFNEKVSSESALKRSREFLAEKVSEDYLDKAFKIRSKVPEQSITSLAFRSSIHHLLFGLSLRIHGGWAGITYPGRQPFLEFSTEQLIEMLPRYIDAVDKAQLPDKIKDFFNLTEPNVYGVSIPDDDFQVAIQIGVYIVRRLEKIGAWVERRQNEGGTIDFYTEDDLQELEE